ncbi:MAG: response regulator [Gammaproteobacteria bacterium]|nr:MAG: response regulator [Gammaproteobacteria bacterium]
MKEEKAIEYLRALTLKITGLAPEKASIKDYIDDIVYYFTNILHSMPNNVYWLDRNCVLRGGNDELAHKLNLKSGFDLEGLTYEQMAQAAKLPTKEFEPYRITELAVMKTGTPSVAKEEPPITDHGNMFYYLSNKTPLKNKAGEIIGVVGISTDITKLKKTQLDLDIALKNAEAANEAKTEFLENMRHDIRTPLSGIVGCARIIKAEANDPKKVSEYSEDLIQSSEALLNFLNKILEGIKVANGEIPLIKKKFDLKKTIQAIIDLNKSLAAKKKLDLTLEIDEKIPPYLMGDPVRLQRIILELVANALRFTQRGSVDIQIKKLKKKTNQQAIIEITVKDTGIGIPLDKQEMIFTAFTRLTPSYKGIYKGIGLGLSIVRQFINDIGGEIYVESKVKKGTTFTCRIPLQVPLVMDNVGIEEISLAAGSESYLDKNSSKLEVKSNYDLDPNQKRILLVEDDKLAAKIAQSILAELDCSIDVAPNAKTALESIQNKDYQLILMDIGLPDMDGIALAHRIRLQQWQRTDTTPIVGLTAHIDVENRQRCLDAGMNTVILKPLNKEMARELLKTFVPDTNVNQIPSTMSRPITGAVLDMDAMKNILKDEELIKDCLHLMVLGLKKDLVELPRLHQSANWQAIREIAHKRQGGASYCGAKRLEQACKQIDDYIRENGPNGQTNTLYRQLIQEMEAAKAVCEDYIK